MSWTRTDDNWTGKRQAEGLNFEEIGYLFALIQHCSKNDIFDGRIPEYFARTQGPCSDVDSILGHLIEVGQAEWDNGCLVLLRAVEHLPSEEVRDRTTAEREKKRRQRAHAKGNHEFCSPTNCQTFHVPGTVPGTTEGQEAVGQPCPANVPGTVGTGQDGPGREEVQDHDGSGTADPWATSPVPRQGGVDFRTGEVTDESSCGWCTGGGCPQCSPGLFDVPASGRHPNDPT